MELDGDDDDDDGYFEPNNGFVEGRDGGFEEYLRRTRVQTEYTSRGPIHLHVFMRSNLIPEWGQYTSRYILKDESGDMEREG